MKIAILKYNAGNTASVKNALVRLGIEPVITDCPEILREADRVIFPGVGEASSAMNYLRSRRLDEAIINLKQPVLGICLGMHLLCAASEENEARCLEIMPVRVRKFSSNDLKIPHIGWNTVFNLKSELFEGIGENSFVYFVHSFYVEKHVSTIASADYAASFSAAVRYKNFYAVQFHPEKSGTVGARILENFLKI